MSRRVPASVLLIGIFASCAGTPEQEIDIDLAPPGGTLQWKADYLWSGLQDHDLEFFAKGPKDSSQRHVHLMHLDGVRPDLFREMLRNRQLPHFALLLARGKLSLHASTLDKSETMKVIQSYMTSKFESEVVGWWQFDRESLRFRNYWMEPMGVINFALGLEFPLRPTLFDLLANDGKPLIAGFNLHHRGVPFEDYARNYHTALQAVSDHTYYRQADETMSAFLKVFQRKVAEERKLPALTTSLLAPTDEFGHYLGVTAEGPNSPIQCFQRDEDPTLDGVFDLLDRDRASDGSILRLNQKNKMLRGLNWRGNRLLRFCLGIPSLELENPDGAGPDFVPAEPKYVLALMFMDLQLGRLIDMLRSIRLGPSGADYRFDQRWGNGIVSYIESRERENSLFENTLFLFFGDHGMVNTRHMMSSADHPRRHPDSIDLSFIDFLNQKMGLDDPEASPESTAVPAGVEYGLDFEHLPVHLRQPHRLDHWQDADTRQSVDEAERWSQMFFDELQQVLRTELSEKYWWLFFLKRFLFDPRFESQTERYRDSVTAALAALYLGAVPKYQLAEQRAIEKFFRDHVRLIYGGGARNNAELMLPSIGRAPDGSQLVDWHRRPSWEQIFDFRGPNGTKLMEILTASPAVGLIFLRRDNQQLSARARLPKTMEILVMNRSGGRGWINVQQAPETGRLRFSYRIDRESQGDPLGYLDVARERDSGWKTFHQWNDWCIENNTRYHNVVAGMGTYLYSTNPAIGDLTLMHSDDWNFGGNAGGHGGVHRGEKLTVMLASGPQISWGRLMAALPGASPDAVGQGSEHTTHPTLLDLTPTALDWLGYEEAALSDFARQGFEAYLGNWVASQKSGILKNLDDISDLRKALREAGVEDLQPSDFAGRLERLLQLMPTVPPPLDSFEGYSIDGNRLVLQ